MFRYKHGVDVLGKLKAAGYSTYVIKRDNVLGQSTLQKFRDGKLPSWGELDKLCTLLNCGPWDLIEYVAEGSDNE